MRMKSSMTLKRLMIKGKLWFVPPADPDRPRSFFGGECILRFLKWLEIATPWTS